VGIVVNRADSEDHARDVSARLDRSCRKFLATSAELRGWLPDDECCVSAEQLRRPLVLRFPQARAAQAIAALAATLLSRERQEMQVA
jgi:flagellar biosynthesis protein FlhG